MHYMLVLLFSVAIAAALALLEWALGFLAGGLSIFDHTGVGQATMYVVIFAAVIAFSKFIAGDRPIWVIGHYLVNWRRVIGGYLTMFVATTLIVTCGYAFLGFIGKIEVSEIGFSAFDPGVMVGVFFMVLGLAFTEEFIFRGFLMRYLRWNTGGLVTAGAMVFSSAVFAAVHNYRDPGAWFSYDQGLLFAGLFTLAMLLSLTYIVTRSLMCAAGIHAALVFSEFFRFRTGSFELVPDVWWMGVSQDIRMAPLVWLLFVVMAILVYYLRDRLAAWFGIETEVMNKGTLPKPDP